MISEQGWTIRNGSCPLYTIGGVIGSVDVEYCSAECLYEEDCISFEYIYDGEVISVVKGVDTLALRVPDTQKVELWVGDGTEWEH